MATGPSELIRSNCPLATSENDGLMSAQQAADLALLAADDAEEAVYLYSDPMIGNDANSGLSPTEPVQTFEQLMNNKPSVYHSGLRFFMNLDPTTSAQNTTVKTYTLAATALQFLFSEMEGENAETPRIYGGFTNELGDLTATAGSATGITTDQNLTLDQYAGAILSIISGTGAGQRRCIRGVTAGPNSVISVESAFTVNPDATSVYRIGYPNVVIQFTQRLLFCAPPQNLYMEGIRFKFTGNTNGVQFQVGNGIGTASGGTLLTPGCEFDLLSPATNKAALQTRGVARFETDGNSTYWCGPNNPYVADDLQVGTYIHDGSSYNANVGAFILSGPGLVKGCPIGIRSGGTYLSGGGGTIDNSLITVAGDGNFCISAPNATVKARIRRAVGTALSLTSEAKSIDTNGIALNNVEFSDITGDMVLVADNSHCSLGTITVAGTNTGWGLKVQTGGKARVAAATALSGALGAIQLDGATLTLAQALAAPFSGTLTSNVNLPFPIVDPGNAGAITVGVSGGCNLTSAGAETRTLAAPTFVGQEIDLCCNVFVGNIAVTVSAGFNVAGNTVITFTAAGQNTKLRGVLIANALRWRLISNDGATLS